MCAFHRVRPPQSELYEQVQPLLIFGHKRKRKRERKCYISSLHVAWASWRPESNQAKARTLWGISAVSQQSPDSRWTQDELRLTSDVLCWAHNHRWFAHVFKWNGLFYNSQGSVGNTVVSAGGEEIVCSSPKQRVNWFCVPAGQRVAVGCCWWSPHSAAPGFVWPLSITLRQTWAKKCCVEQMEFSGTFLSCLCCNRHDQSNADQLFTFYSWHLFSF